MSQALIDKLRRARESVVPVNGRKFTIRRPTAEDYALNAGKGLALIRLSVVGWGEMTELDLGIPGGSDAKVEFSPALWSEWIGDHSEYWGGLIEAINAAIDSNAEKKEAAAKN